MRYTIIKTDGSETPWMPAKKDKPTLDELQGIVGGLIERVTVKGGYLWVNEEGIIKRLPINHKATRINKNTLLVGDVLLCQRNPKKED